MVPVIQLRPLPFQLCQITTLLPSQKHERLTLLHRHALPKIDAACETEKTTKELIKHFSKFKIGEGQEEDDSSPDSSSNYNIPLSQLYMQNVVGNPELKKNQTKRRKRRFRRSRALTNPRFD
jgi:hypothetical protein